MSGLHLHWEADTAWPRKQSWESVGHEITRILDDEMDDEIEVRADGSVWSVPDRVPLGFALTQGEHLLPGALYVSRWPNVRMASAAIGVGGEPSRRRVHAQFRHTGYQSRATLDLDALDDPRSLRTEGDLKYLSWTGEANRDPDRLLRGKFSLRWLGGGIEARVRRTDGGRTVLAVDLGLYGKGVWSAPVNLALKVARKFIDEAALEIIHDAATTLVELDDPEQHVEALVARQAMRERNAEHALELVRRREAAFLASDPPRHGFFSSERRWRRRWLAHYDALDPVRWPPCSLPDQEWRDLERDLYAQYPHWELRDGNSHWVSELFERRYVPRDPEPHLLSVDQATDPGWLNHLSDDTFDLAWLRSPWRIFRHMQALEAQYDAQLSDTAPGRQAAEGISSTDRRLNDEHDRRFA